MSWLTLLGVCGLLIWKTEAFPDGAGDSACVTMQPGHYGTNASETPPEYVIKVSASTYCPGGSLQVSVERKDDGSPPFKGFLLRAQRLAGNSVQHIGRYSPTNDLNLTRTKCDDIFGQVVTHTSPVLKNFITVTWNAPPVSQGPIVFLATVVQKYTKYWIRIPSQVIEPDTECTTFKPTLPTTLEATTRKRTTNSQRPLPTSRQNPPGKDGNEETGNDDGSGNEEQTGNTGMPETDKTPGKGKDNENEETGTNGGSENERQTGTTEMPEIGKDKKPNPTPDANEQDIEDFKENNGDGKNNEQAIDEPKKKIDQSAFGIGTGECGSTRGCCRSPKSCRESKCNLLMTWKDQGDSVNIELSAEASGWIAVGFSDDQTMGNDSVTECVLIRNEGRVVIRNSYNDGNKNIVLPMESNSVLDDMKAFAAVTNGTNRIRCRFNRKKTGHGTKVFALTKPYYLLLAMGNVTGDGTKFPHRIFTQGAPRVSAVKIDLTTTKEYKFVV